MTVSPALLAAACLVCVVLGSDLTEYFATVRPYPYNDGKPSDPLSGCSLSGIYYVSRHGSRYPTAGKIKKQMELAEFVHKYNVKGDFKWMKDWTPGFSLSQEGMLSELGAKDLVKIGKRFAKNYKSLISDYTPNTVTTQCTGVPRTAQTAAAFTTGAVDDDKKWMERPWVAVSESKKNDKELRFFDTCQRYIDEVDENKSATPEVDKFMDSVTPKIAAKLEKLTGIPAADLVSNDMVERMWDTCTYELTVLEKDRWCKLFDKEDAKDFEYAEDIEKYYARGYGISLSYKIAAPLLQSIFKYTADVIDGKEGTPKAKLMFAHAETVLPLKAILGLHKESTPLLASWTKDQREKRVWRTSEICTMASNLAFVVSKCSNGNHQIQMLESETPVNFPGVSGCSKNWCPLSAVRTAYTDALNIKFERLCSCVALLCIVIV
eukprot:m51a1_g1612 hypothetical protein (435) ;mRNA; r:205998-207394